MEPPSLKLIIAKGPREGETLELRPGSDVRIGRIVRGNNLPIKDVGISSKHLSIKIESGRWVVRDHDSSNGTILNGSKIPPNILVYLHDGDSIKIGEYTSIEVKMGAFEESRLRRNPRRGAAAKGSVFDEVGSVAKVKDQRDGELEEKSEVVGENAKAVVEPVRKQRRGRTKKGLGLEVVEELNKVQTADENVMAREESDHVDALPEKVEPAINKRVTRNSKKQRGVIVISDSDSVNSSQKILVGSVEKRRTGNRKLGLALEGNFRNRILFWLKLLTWLTRETQRSSQWEDVMSMIRQRWVLVSERVVIMLGMDFVVSK